MYNDIIITYKYFKIRKNRFKFREIYAPNEELKIAQKEISKNILSLIPIHKCAYGFVKNVSIQDNANRHLDKNNILTIDLKNFFPSIKTDMVYKSLIDNNIDIELVKDIIRICTYKGFTPQGCPSSPIISNIVFKPIDKKLYSLAKKNNCIYTRYADDLTFSGEYNTLLELKPKIASILNKYNFNINGSKTKTIGKHRSMNVTGIVINTGVKNVPRKELKIFKSNLYELLSKENITLEEYQKTYGYYNFITHINKKYINKYIHKIDILKRKIL